MDFCIFNLMAKIHGNTGWDQDVANVCNAICAKLGHQH